MGTQGVERCSRLSCPCCTGGTRGFKSRLAHILLKEVLHETQKLF